MQARYPPTRGTPPVTDTSAPASAPAPIPDFEGTPVHSTGFTMPGASGGLNAALVVDNLVLHKDEVLTLAFQVKVRDINHKAMKDTPGWQRVHVLDVQNATMIPSDAVADLLEAQRRRVEEAQGIQHLDFEAPDP